jgi:excisionase family DNA binding protein
MQEDERYLTVMDCEKLTGRKASTWRRDIFERKIAFVKIGRQVRIPLSEINKLVKAGWRPAVPTGQK